MVAGPRDLSAGGSPRGSPLPACSAKGCPCALPPLPTGERFSSHPWASGTLPLAALISISLCRAVAFLHNHLGPALISAAQTSSARASWGLVEVLIQGTRAWGLALLMNSQVQLSQTKSLSPGEWSSDLEGHMEQGHEEDLRRKGPAQLGLRTRGWG